MLQRHAGVTPRQLRDNGGLRFLVERFLMSGSAPDAPEADVDVTPLVVRDDDFLSP